MRLEANGVARLLLYYRRSLTHFVLLAEDEVAICRVLSQF